MRFPGRHHTSITSQKGTWPLEKSYIRLLPWSEIQWLGLTIAFLFLQQRCPWPSHIHGGLREITLLPPQALISPIAHWCHQAPVTEKAVRDALTVEQLLRDKVWRGWSWPGEVRKKWGVVTRRWDGWREREREGEGRLPLSVAPTVSDWSFSSLITLSAGPIQDRVSSFLLWALKSIGYWGEVLNLKLCQPCQISVHNWFSNSALNLFSSKSSITYRLPNFSVSFQKDLFHDWPYLGEILSTYLPLCDTETD